MLRQAACTLNTSVSRSSREPTLLPFCKASVCALQAQLLQQPSLERLPDVLLHRILCIVWDARPASEASSEVQLALSLQCVSRRFHQVLRAHPLQLRLDFSHTRLAERHLAWLALPAWKDHVTLLTLYNWLAPACEARSRNFLHPGLCAENDVVSPLLTVLLANQRGSLRQLLGMPLCLGGVRTEPLPDYSGISFDHFLSSLHFRRHVDLRTFHLTHLGVSGGYNDAIQFEWLPQTMVSLVFRAAHEEASVQFWLSCAAARAEIIVLGGSPVADLTRSWALDGWHLKIKGGTVGMVACSPMLGPPPLRSTLTNIKVVRIDARSVRLCHDSYGEEPLSFEVFIDLLCPASLERMEITSGSYYPRIEKQLGERGTPNAWRLVMGKMMGAYGSQFAFEIDDGSQKRSAWRRWPAQGTQEHDAAWRLHLEARRWAAA